MKPLGRVIVLVFTTTHLNPLESQRIRMTDPLLCVKILEYHHLIAQYLYHTEATIECMEDYLQDFHHQQDTSGQFRTNQSTKKVSEALIMLLNFDNLQEREWDPTGTVFLRLQDIVALKKMKRQIQQEIAQHFVDE
jgi:hypothetical protein